VRRFKLHGRKRPRVAAGSQAAPRTNCHGAVAGCKLHHGAGACLRPRSIAKYQSSQEQPAVRNV